MGLPTIAPYRLPGPADLPANRVTWTPDPARAVLLIHDLQRYFVAAYDQAAPPLAPALDNIVRLRARCRELGVPVIYSAQPGDQDPRTRGLLGDFWGPGLSARDEAIVARLAPDPGEHVVSKRRYDAFLHTDLERRIRGAGRDQLLVTGIYTHIGCVATACHAFMIDIAPFVVADATADFSAAHHAGALRWAAQRCAVVATTDSVLAALRAAPSLAAASNSEERT